MKTVENMLFADSSPGALLDDEKADTILDLCYQKIGYIHGFSFAKNILEMHKQHTKSGLGKAKAL